MRKCLYCDFYSHAGCAEDDRERYLRALEAHIAEYGALSKGYAVTSVYFGGGTPSLLSVKQMNALMKCIRTNFRVSPKAEVSMEVNPGTVSAETLRGYRKSGVNRLSIGVQSFNDADLKTCGRIHKAADAFEAITLARKALFDNISLDLMFGLPEQTLQTVVDNVNTAISLEPEHISLYGLKIEPDTPFDTMYDMLRLPDEDEERSMYFNAAGLLENAGLRQYEISNFAKKGKMCRHNIRYWNCDEYIGFGPAAHSYFGGKRFSFKRDLALYTDSFDPEKTVTDTLLDEMIDIPYSSRVAEYVMLRFRLTSGVQLGAFRKRFGRSFDEMYLEKMEPFIKSGHIVRTANGYALTREGMYVSNYILSRIVDFDLIIPGTN